MRYLPLASQGTIFSKSLQRLFIEQINYLIRSQGGTKKIGVIKKYYYEGVI
jgi:hypothetical protein